MFPTVTANKRAEAPTARTGVCADAGFFFSGWCREGFWSEGRLLRGKDGRTVNISKFLRHSPQEALQRTLERLV
jgi:hypothetical protein